MIQDRVNTYDLDYCWQYHIRLENLHEDLEQASITKEYADSLRIRDFTFKVVTDKEERETLKEFIKRHEWLGNLSQYTTHWFACYHKNILAGVNLFNIPNAFSKMLGDDTHKIERLISRGACISWSPQNLASWFLMTCIKWMVQNTPYRLFVAYSDPTAKELGTIYQACNFYYVGQKSGTTTRYINPYTGKIVSDRFFRVRSAIRRYAKELGIEWQKEWTGKTRTNWELIPDDIEKRLRDYAKEIQAKATKIIMPSKHKYAYVLGVDKRETKELRKLFEERNKIREYPKNRGK